MTRIHAFLVSTPIKQPHLLWKLLPDPFLVKGSMKVNCPPTLEVDPIPMH
jgi:hypothetical protein